MKLNATVLAECPYLPSDKAALISPYGYVPTAYICIIFLVCFAISTAVHLGEAVRWRTWWLLPTAVLCGIGEVAGWGGRLWSSHNVCSSGFMMQIISLIISPTPLIAANFIILGRLIAKVGPEYSRLNPQLYARIFLSCDLLALVIQAAGGAIASTSNTPSGSSLGGNIMLGGIVFQLISITAFAGLASEFFWRRLKHLPFPNRAAALARSEPSDVEMKEDHARGESRSTFGLVHDGDAPGGLALHTRLALVGLVLSTVLLYIRSIYRTAELSDGWHGTIIRTQVYFNVFDGMMILLSMVCLNVLHPGYLLSE